MNSTDPIKRAKMELDSIVKLAQENILRESEEKINKLIEEAMEEVQNEDATDTVSEPINEMIKLETDDMKIVVDDDGSTKVEHKEAEPEAAAAAPAEPVDAVTQAPVDATPATVVTAAPVATPVDAVGDDEEIELSSDEDEIQIAAEAEETPQAMNQDTPPVPAADAAPAAPEAAPAPAEAEMSPEELIMKGIKELIAQTAGGSDAGDSVDIVDDEAGAPAPAAPAETAPAAPAAPAMEEVIELDEEDELIELELEEDEAVMDEIKMMGLSNTVKKKAGLPSGPEPAMKRALPSQKVNEQSGQDKAQYEATIAELKKENKSLKGQIGEFKTAFIELREHYNEVQTFNKKLALAYRVVSNGGLTEKEKARISERFEAAKDAEEAEKIYKDIISEKNISQEKGVIKSSAIPVAQPKKTPIYESAEAKRARVLAGIDSPDPESLIG